MADRRATAAQIRKLHFAAREVGLDQDGLYELVKQASNGGSSISALTVAQAGAVIDQLVRLGATKGRQKKPSGRPKVDHVAVMISAEQRDLIEQLRRDLGESWLQDEYFQGACRRLIARPRPVTSADGVRVIEMLKARRAHDHRKQAADV